MAVGRYTATTAAATGYLPGSSGLALAAPYGPSQARDQARTRLRTSLGPASGPTAEKVAKLLYRKEALARGVGPRQAGRLASSGTSTTPVAPRLSRRCFVCIFGLAFAFAFASSSPSPSPTPSLSRRASSTAPHLTCITYVPYTALAQSQEPPRVLAGLSPYRRRITSTAHPAARHRTSAASSLTITNVLVIDSARRSAGSRVLTLLSPAAYSFNSVFCRPYRVPAFEKVQGRRALDREFYYFIPRGRCFVGIVHEFDDIQHYRTGEAQTQVVGIEWEWQGERAGVASTEQNRPLQGQEGSGGQQVGVQCGRRGEKNAVSDQGQ